MYFLLFAGLSLTGVMAAWELVNPRSMWLTLEAWKYKRPEANEPSDAEFVLRRILGFVGLVVVVVFWILLRHVQQDSVPDNLFPG
ncbi:MAG TPA: hypothetical protein VE287_09230 [Actinopolymorphaceae bacterium]|nr:hypothetical protein [Actinopolymorphaceae bacterium]